MFKVVELKEKYGAAHQVVLIYSKPISDDLLKERLHLCVVGNNGTHVQMKNWKCDFPLNYFSEKPIKSMDNHVPQMLFFF